MRATTISALVVAVGLLALDVVVAADPCASRTSCTACVHASCAWQYMAGVSNVGQCVPVAAGRSAAVTVVDAGQCPSSLQMALESTIVPQIGALCLLFLAATGIAVHMFVGRMRAMLASDAVADAQNGTQVRSCMLLATSSSPSDRAARRSSTSFTRSCRTGTCR